MALSKETIKWLEKIHDAIYGVAIGDALGVPYEFRKREDVALNPCVDMVGYGTYDMPIGTWSDDTSMTLAALVGISKMQSQDDYNSIMAEFLAWLNEEKYTIDGVFDVGRTCMDAILKYNHGLLPLDCGGRSEFHNGNGSLMRIMPAVLYSLIKFGKVNEAFIADISALTHGHEISKTACIIYANVAEMLMNVENSKQDIDAYIDATVEKIKTVLADNLAMQEVFFRLMDRNFYSLSETEIKSSGYVVDTLEAALWGLFSTKQYSECVLKVVNLGYDTDTVAAVAGGLAGLYYGKNNIPKKWIDNLKGKDIIDQAINEFADSLLKRL